MGAPPPTTVVELGASSPILVHVDRDDPKNVRSVDQLVVQVNGQDCFIPLFSGMRPEQLKKRLDELGVSNLVGSRLDCDDKNWSEFNSLVCDTDPSCRIQPTGSTDAGIHPVRGRTTVTVNKHYFRALAKIAFHYYLVHNRRGLLGDEPEFAPIRDFIMEGIGEHSTFFKNSGRHFCLPFGPTPDGGLRCPSIWSHLLVVDESAEVVVVYLHLFLGPGVHRPGAYVTLGPLASKIVLPIMPWGSLYIYDDPQPKFGTAGHIESVEVTLQR
jgi:hypothetical protein